MIAISEVKNVLPAADPHNYEGHHGSEEKHASGDLGMEGAKS